MTVCVLLAIVYIAACVGIAIMKKIQPNDRIYPVWVVAVCILLTLFIGWRVSLQ